MPGPAWPIRAKAIVELTDEQVRELLTGLELRVRDHLQDAVTAAELSEKLMSKAVLREDPDVLARHFTEVLRANPTFAWASYSDAIGDFTGAYRAPDGSLHVSQTALRASPRLYVKMALGSGTMSRAPTITIRATKSSTKPPSKLGN